LVRRDLVTRPLSKAELRHAGTTAVIQHRADDDEWLLPVQFTAHLVPEADDPDVQHLVFRGQLTINPETAAGGRPLRPGHWDLQLRVSQFGASGKTRPKGRKRRALARPVVAGSPAAAIVPYVTEGGNLAFDSGPRSRALNDVVAADPSSAAITDGRLLVDLDLDVTTAAAPMPMHVSLRGGGGAFRCPANVVWADGGGRLLCEPPERFAGKRPARRLSVVVRHRKKDQPVTVATVSLDRQGQFADAAGIGTGDAPVTERAVRFLRRRARQVVRKARHRAARARAGPEKNRPDTGSGG
jgi:hypothetical protein